VRAIFGPVISMAMAAQALRSAELGPVPLSLLLLPGASGCPQAPLDVAGRETPERGGLGQSQKRSGSEALVAGMQGK
jgi:hypothetical protein